MIKCLSEEVQEKLRSGVAIFSLQQCIEELVVNSIDAGATCIGVRMDMEACKVQVIDNGSGIDQEDMERVGNRYFTSKCRSIEDLDNLRFYGYRGEAVASLVSLSMLVEISSRTKLSVKTYVKMFKDGKGLDVFECDTSRPSAGTTVVICNFFHNMPVRRKRLDAVLEYERIRQRVEAISLLHPSVSFTLKNDCTGAMVVQLSKARNTYYRFVQIHGLGRAQKLREIHQTHSQFQVSGFIGREGHYNNSLQFVFVNDRLLLKTRVHKLMNLLLRKVSVTDVKNHHPDVAPAVRSPKLRRGGELHGMYLINVKCPYSEYDICLEPAKTLVEFKDWEGLLFCIEEAVKTFLTRESLVSELYPEDLEEETPKLFSAAGQGRREDSRCQEALSALGVAIPECSVGQTLASESVHRRPSRTPASNQITESVDQVDDSDATRRVGQGIKGEDVLTTTQCVSGPPMTSSEPLECGSASSTEGSDTVSKTSCVAQGPPNASEESHGSDQTLLTSAGSHPTQTEEGCHGVNSDSVFAVSLPRNSVPAPSNIVHYKPALPHQKGFNFEGHRKICLSDPFIHQRLPSHRRRPPLFPRQPAPSWKCQESSQLKKRRASCLEISSHVREDENHCKDFSSVVPLKISKVMSCQRLSLGKEAGEAGSLDRFRRIYGKSRPLEGPSLDSSTSLSPIRQEDPAVENSITSADEGEKELVTDVMVPRQEIQCDIKSPLTLSAFTKLKPLSSDPSDRGSSLAAKLSLLHRLGVQTSTSTGHSEPPSNEDAIVWGKDGNVTQDVNNNQDRPCDTRSQPEPDTGPDPDPDPDPDPEPDPDPDPDPDPVPEPEPDPDPDVGPGCDPMESGEAGLSGDWVSHYDDSVGRVVYVNRVTGLSRYQEPTVEETHARCSSDLTNMAVSVVSNAGIECRCYPFPMDLVLPFLPKPRAERGGLSSGPVHQGDTEASLSLSSVFCEWTNPVFLRPPKVGVDVSSGQAEGLAVKIHNILFPYRFSKDMVHSMKVIHQVDGKFLACLMNTREQAAASGPVEGNLLVLVDQHAAHERVRLESLVADSYEENPEVLGERRLRWSALSPPLEVQLTEEETRLLRSCQAFLRGLGLKLQFSSPPAEEPKVLVAKVPVCFTEKESSELRRGRQSVIKPIVEEYLREQIEALRLTGRVRGTLPLTILKVLASIACHGAIKFNHSLSREECSSLVGSLAECQLPFQCAHGRPSIAPLLDFLHLDTRQQESQKPNLHKLRRLHRAWELHGNK